MLTQACYAVRGEGDRDRRTSIDQDGPTTAAPGFPRRLANLSTAIAAFYGLGLLSWALLPLLIRDLPLLLVLMNPATGVLVLVSERIPLIPFVALATVRRVIFHLLFYALGAGYGARAVGWLEERSGGAIGMVRLVEQVFVRVRWPIILLFPGALPSVLAGAVRMPLAHFLAVDLAGTVGSILVVRYAAEVAADPIGALLRFSDQHAVLLTAICVGATALWLLVRWRRGRAAGANMGLPWSPLPAAPSATDQEFDTGERR